MKWITPTKFQVTEDTPERELRGLAKREVRSMVLLLKNALKTRRSEIQKAAKQRLAEFKTDLDEGFITQEEYDELKKGIDKSTRTSVHLLSQYIDTSISPQNIVRMVGMLSIESGQDFEYDFIKLIVPDFDKKKEYDQLTEGNVLDIVNTINHLSSLTQKDKDGLDFLADSPDRSTANGAAPSADSTDSTEKETVMEQ